MPQDTFTEDTPTLDTPTLDTPLDGLAKIHPETSRALMTDSAPVPTGRLKTVRRDWEYRPGFVMTPLREIAFNSRLTKQARLVWMWLASVPARPTRISWGECETMLGCGTKARRNCIAQLVTEGYISIDEEGHVVMHDPYEVYDAKRIEVLDEIRSEWSDQYREDREDCVQSDHEKILLEKKIDDNLREFKLEPPIIQKPEVKPKKEKENKSDIIVNAWNKCKPETYSSIRVISAKQQESIAKHMKNLSIGQSNIEFFICSVCSGLKKSQFWSEQVYKSSRNFNSVFGYGNPQDTKMKNVENLYFAGQDDEPQENEPTQQKFNEEQQTLIDTYRYINLNYTNAKAREDESEANRWHGHLLDVLQQLEQEGVSIEDFQS